ncbi:Family 3 adenylate cyclase [Pelomyxa schiedti]|nr:Family 3 adenylate cyclase [Pelomyxa schiedti]
MASRGDLDLRTGNTTTNTPHTEPGSTRHHESHHSSMGVLRPRAGSLAMRTKPKATEGWASAGRVSGTTTPKGLSNTINGDDTDYYNDRDTDTEEASTMAIPPSVHEGDDTDDEDGVSINTSASAPVSLSNSLASSGSSGSSSSSSSSTFGISELMVRRLKTGLTHWCQMACSKSSSHISVPLCIIQFIQMLSFTLDPTLGWLSLNSSWKTFLKVVSFPRTLGVNYNYTSILVLEIVFTVYLLSLCLLGVFVVFKYKTNFQYEGKFASLLHLEVELFSTVLYAPLAYTTLAVFVCSSIAPEGMDYSCSSGSMISQSIIMGLLLIIGTVIAFLSTSSQYDCHISSKHPLARFLSRVEIIQFITVALASCFSRYLRYPVISVTVCQGIVASIIVLGCACCILYTLYYAPYYKWWANYLKIGGFSAVLTSSAIAFFQSVFPENARDILIAVICSAVLVPVLSCLGGMAFFHWTNISLKRNLSKILFDNETTDNQSLVTQISKSLRSVHMVAFHLYWDLTTNTSTTRDTVDNMTRILFSFIETHPGPNPEILFSLFLLQQSEELQTVAIHIQRAQSHDNQWPDTKLLIIRLEEYRREKTRAFDGGNEEIEFGFRQAEKNHKKAQDALCQFWQQLLIRNIGSLPEHVATLDSAEKSATEIYERLKKKFPKSSRVLRQYALFLDQIKNDPHQAQIMYAAADSLEENTTKHHKHRKPFRHNQIAPESFGESGLTTVKFKNSDKRSVTPPSNPQAQLAAQKQSLHKRSQDSQKIQWYKERVATLESSVFKQLYLSIFTVLGVILVNTTITYAISRWALSGFIYAYKETSYTANLTSFVPHLNYLVEKQTMGLLYPSYNNSNAMPELLSAADIFQELDRTLYIDAAKGKAVDFTLWTGKVHNISTWDEATHTRSSMIVSLSYLLEEYSRRASDLATSAHNHSDPSSFQSDPNLRFMLDNGYSVIRPALEQLTLAYRESVLSQMRSSRLLLSVLLPVTVVIVVACVAGLFIRSIILIRKERLEVLRLFLCLSRTTVRQIYETCTEKKQGFTNNASFSSITSGDSLNTAEMSKHQVNSIKIKFVSDVTIRFTVGVCVLVLFIVAISAFSISSLRQFSGPLDLTSSRILERSTLQRIHTAAASLINRDFITFNDMNGLHQYLRSGLQSYDEAQNISSGITRTWHVEITDKALRELLLYDDCSDIVLSHCEGLDEIDNIFISAAVAINNIPDKDATVSCPQWLTMDRVDERGLWPWHIKLESMLLDYFISQIERYESILTALFATAWPFAAIVYALLHIPLKQIHQQHFHTLRMFLLIPVDVIESTPQIKHFLETGEKTDTTEQMQKMLKDTQTKTERLIQAAADAVIIVDFETLNIQTFNTAAETMFGWTSGEIVGSHLARLICKDWLENQKTHVSEKNTEAVGISKEGVQFPVLISKSTAALESGTVAILIVRDVREIRGYQKLLEQNENLLLKMLPKSIAQRLKSSIASAKDKTQPLLIADRHPQVSILFADIVKFSEWSTTIDAENLVEILNGIVSIWDVIALSFHVEKIKTIGDCYMCVCGCPEPDENHAQTLLRFATEMLYSLDDFNKSKKTDIHVRIGINSGPVVAGVIGLSKVMYDIWSPSVNMASRMESSGVPDAVQVTENTARLLGSEFPLQPRGEVEIKGGYKVNAFLYKPPPPNSQNRHPIIAEMAQARPHSASSVSNHSSVHAWGKLISY